MMMNVEKAQRRTLPVFFVLGFLLAAGLLYLYGETWLRHLLLYLSKAAWARSLVSNLPIAQRVAMRFVAGQDRAAAMSVTRTLNRNGLMVTLDYLGESVSTAEEAGLARDEIITLLDCIAQERLDANVSVKLSQLGLKIGESLAQDNLRQIVDRAQRYGTFVRVDMEDSPVVDATLHIFRRLRWEEGYRNVGVVIQSYLYRSEEDIRQLVDEGARVRLCKGAYAEPAEVAFPHKADTDANYVKLAQMLLSPAARQNGVYPAFATHDERMIREIQAYVAANQVPRDSYEFQMLYGIRRDLQDALVQQGERVRVYVPYGTAWYPYFVRRLAERPANLWFFVSNFFRT